jgi:hypothetical protein
MRRARPRFFGFVPVRQFRVQRRSWAGVKLVRFFQDAQLIQASRLIGSLPAVATVDVFCGIWAHKYARFLPLSRFSIVAMPAL